MPRYWEVSVARCKFRGHQTTFVDLRHLLSLIKDRTTLRSQPQTDAILTDTQTHSQRTTCFTSFNDSLYTATEALTDWRTDWQLNDTHYLLLCKAKIASSPTLDTHAASVRSRRRFVALSAASRLPESADHHYLRLTLPTVRDKTRRRWVSVVSVRDRR